MDTCLLIEDNKLIILNSIIQWMLTDSDSPGSQICFKTNQTKYKSICQVYLSTTLIQLMIAFNQHQILYIINNNKDNMDYYNNNHFKFHLKMWMFNIILALRDCEERMHI